MEDSLLSIPEASEQFDIPQPTLRAAIRAGTLRARKISRDYVVRAIDIQRWKDNPDAHKRGPKPTKS